MNRILTALTSLIATALTAVLLTLISTTATASTPTIGFTLHPATDSIYLSLSEINEQTTSVTESGISASSHAIHDSEAQQQLTGQSSEQTLASLNTTVTTETADAKASNGHSKTKHS